jgi:Fe-S oxidoreductase
MAKTSARGRLPEVAEWFETLAKAERSHAGRFTKGLGEPVTSCRASRPPHGLRPRDPAFFDVGAVGKELARVTEICDGLPALPPPLLRRSTSCSSGWTHHEGDVAKVASRDYRRVVDLCWQCKLCYNHCPYTPPHRLDIDFPRLMLRAKAARAQSEGVTRQDRWLGDATRGNAGARAAAPLSNWANRFAPARACCWRPSIGVDREA